MATLVGILRAIGIILSLSSPSYFNSKIDIEKYLNSKTDLVIELDGKITLK